MRCISDRREQSAATKQLCYSGMSAIISNPQHHQPHHLHEGSTTRAHLAGPGNRKHRHACDSTCHTIASIRAHPPPTIHTTTPILHRHPPAITSSSSAPNSAALHGGRFSVLWRRGGAWCFHRNAIMGHQKFFGTWKGLVLSRLGGKGLACDAEICFLNKKPRRGG